MVAIKKKSEKRIKKEAYWERLQALTDKYNKALFVDGDNVSSLQITKLRYKLRAIDAVMVMGKNTLMKAALNHKMKKPEEGDEDYEERKDTWKPCEHLEKFVNMLKGNTGIIFTNGDLSKIKEVIDEEAREAPAKVGSIAPLDVVIPAGSTGLDPKQTAFFQNLNIQTKIVKTQIEIVSEKKIISEGQKVEQSHAALLDKLKIRPFSYKMEIKTVYDNGSMFSAKVLDITPEDIRKKLQLTITNMASISLATGYVTRPAIPHILANSFKNLVAATMDSDYSFPAADKMKAAAKNAPAAGAPAAGGAAKGGAAAAEEPKEEEADVDMGDLFGGGDEY